MPARLALLLLVPLLAAAQPLPVPFRARVVAIHDGDTLTVLRNREQVRIRLFGIDCPEPGQPFHARATQRTAELAHNQAVTVQPESRDTFGRLVAWIILPDGRSLNETLVAEGLAWHFRRYAPRHARLAALEQDARDSGRGLWRDAEPVAPWMWRRQSRNSSERQ